MTVLFQGAELEDFSTRVGTVTMATSPSGAFNSANSRGSVRLSVGSDYDHYAENVFSELSELWFHTVFWRSSASGGYYPFFTLYSGATRLLTIQFTSASSSDVVIRKQEGNTTLASTTGNKVNHSTLYSLDLYIKIGNPGSVLLYINGVLQASASGVDLTWAGVTGINKFRLSNPAGASGSNQFAHFSEIIVADVPTIGSKLVTRIPDANGAHTEWTGGFGDIDEMVPDAAILTSDTADQRASFGLTDFPTALSNEIISALKLTGLARRGVIGPQNANLFTRVGGADYHGSDQALTSSYAPISNAWATNPAGGDWTAAALNAAEFGIRSRA